MKTSIILIALVLFIPNLIWSQTSIEKGTFSLGGNISFTSNYEETSDLNSTIFIFNPRFDYFIINNLSLGIMINYQNTSFVGQNNSSWGIGPSARYYFEVQTIKPFLGIGYSFAQQDASLSDDKIKQNNIILNLGADYFLTNDVTLETIISYTFMNIKYPQFYSTYYSDLKTQRKALSIGLGVNVFLHN